VELLATVVLAAVTGLAASALTNAASARQARAERDDRGRIELRVALTAYGYALDRLDIEIVQLPPKPGRMARFTSRQAARLPILDWLVGRLAMHSLGRPMMRALDEFAAAANRLTLVAPESMLQPMEKIGWLLSRIGQRDERWRANWRAARAELFAVARAQLVCGSKLTTARLSRNADPDYSVVAV
jgi:hypothetical protein